MNNGLDIYYSKNVGRGLRPVSNNNNDNKQTFSKGKGCKKVGSGLKILQ